MSRPRAGMLPEPSPAPAPVLSHEPAARWHAA